MAVSILSCSREEAEKGHPDLPSSEFRDGDIAFRRGRGLASRLITETGNEGAYSHIGIIRKQQGKCLVIHAVPGEPEFEGDCDRIRMESVDNFFAPDRAVCGAVMRLKKDTVAPEHASRIALHLYNAHILFDHNYDLDDSSKMYCTEMVEYAYRHAGITLAGENMTELKIPGFNGRYIFPSDIARSDRLYTVYHY